MSTKVSFPVLKTSFVKPYPSIYLRLLGVCTLDGLKQVGPISPRQALPTMVFASIGGEGGPLNSSHEHLDHILLHVLIQRSLFNTI
jgi:hypothetical protein